MENKIITPNQQSAINDICLILGVTFGGKHGYEADAFIERYYKLARQKAVEELNQYRRIKRED